MKCKVENLRSKLDNIDSDIEKKEDTLVEQSVQEISALDLAPFEIFLAIIIGVNSGVKCNLWSVTLKNETNLSRHIMKLHLLYCETCDMHFKYGSETELEP